MPPRRAAGTPLGWLRTTGAASSWTPLCGSSSATATGPCRSRRSPARSASRARSSTACSTASAICSAPCWTARSGGRSPSWRAPCPRRRATRTRREFIIGAVRSMVEVVASDPDTWYPILLPPDGTPAVVRERIDRDRERVRAAVRGAAVLGARAARRPGGRRPRARVALAARRRRAVGPARAQRPGAVLRRAARGFVEGLLGTA